jgi:predicted ABC-type ATPase
MSRPELIFVAGPNAAGKSTFIRTRLNELTGFQIIMTDVYKSRTREIFNQVIRLGKSIILETVFNDESFKDMVDQARNAGYDTSLVALFLDDPRQSINRVAVRGMQQSGITISGSNVKINFNESFKNLATYFFYFDRSDFIYTGVGGENRQIMSFHKGSLQSYKASDLRYPQKFAQYAHSHDRLDKESHRIITGNQDYQVKDPLSEAPQRKFTI